MSGVCSRIRRASSSKVQCPFHGTAVLHLGAVAHVVEPAHLVVVSQVERSDLHGQEPRRAGRPPSPALLTCVLHLQLRVPAPLTDQVVELLCADDTVTNVAVFEDGYANRPARW